MEIVVIGGGAVGCGVAYHLARAGKTDVLVVEKEPTVAAAQSQPRYSRVRIGASGGSQPKSLGFDVKVEPNNSGFSTRYFLYWVYMNPLHGRQVDNDTSVADSVTGEAVSATSHRQQQIIVPGEIDRIDDIRHSGAAGD